MTSPAQNVTVIVAGGNVNPGVIGGLFAPDVKHVKTDYSKDYLVKVLKGQDVVISTFSSIAPGNTLALQKAVINAAIDAGVQIFLLSEYGIDTSDRRAAEETPFVVDKLETLNYLKTKQDKTLHTALVTGSVFDWGLDIPGFGGLDVLGRTATIYDGGDVPYEATNLDQVGRATAKCLQKPDVTKNSVFYANSFTVTQKQILSVLERELGKFKVLQATAEDLWEVGNAAVKQGQPLGALAMIAASLYNDSGLAQYSTHEGLMERSTWVTTGDFRGVFARVHCYETVLTSAQYGQA